MQELSKKELKTFLEEAPLYARKDFKRPSVNWSHLEVQEIEVYCSRCKKSRPFKDMSSRGGGSSRSARLEDMASGSALRSGTSNLAFTCASCREEKILVFVQQTATEDRIVLMKFGELPRRVLDRDPVLQKFFSDDANEYEKATVCLANGYGVGAFAYYRRIVENNISRLLTLINDEIKATEGDHDQLEAIGALRKDSPMSDKIKVATTALPAFLVPNGLNPLGRLYQVLSGGVHALSDEECLERSVQVKECLKFLVSELASRAEHRKQFAATVSKL